MRINYTGKMSGLTTTQEEKLQVRFAKLSKLLDTPAEQRQAHVIVKTERRLTKAEITVHYFGNDLVGAASDQDPYNAMTAAAHNLETQILKARKKRVDNKRHSPSGVKALAAAAAEPVALEKEKPRAAKARLYRPRVAEAVKPMTAEEAVASMGKKVNYLLFRDPDGAGLALAIRRHDGNFDIIDTQEP